VPFLSTAVAAAAVLAVGDPAARSALLPVLAAGDVVGAAVLTGTTFVAEERDSGWVVTGTASHVADGTHADLFVVCADTGAGEAVLAVATDSPGVRVRSLTSLDVLRPIAALELTEAAATLIGRAPDVGEWPALDVAVSAQLVAVACEQVGGAARCLHTTVEYLKTREQFGVPIGTFQALKHRCADMLTALEAARSIAYDTRDRVAAALDGAGRDTIRAAAAAAACWCSDTYVRIAQENVQMHGGIGFTWEHDAHLHVRRSRADQLLYGTPRQHRAVVAAALGI
jgi:alkylation response protein AidB-like acyl-CoA dehydrogenase